MQDLKDKGNAEFKAGNFENAVLLYSSAIEASSASATDGEARSILFSNRAAAQLKLLKFSVAIEDSEKAIALNPSNSKAIYRLACAQFQLGEDKSAYNSLSRLLSIDPKNSDGIKLMRDVRQRILDEERNSSPISKALQALKNDKALPLVSILKQLAALCAEDKYNAWDFGKRGGVVAIARIFNEQLLADDCDASNDSSSVLCIRILSMASSQKIFVQNYVSMNEGIKGCGDIEDIDGDVTTVNLCNANGQLVFEHTAKLIASDKVNIAVAALHACVQMLKCYAELEEEAIEKEGANNYPPLARQSATIFVSSLNIALRSGDAVLFTTAADAFSAFISDCPAFFSTPKLVDTRYENMDDRKQRLKMQKHLHDRGERHGRLAASEGSLAVLVDLLDAENPLMRQRAGVCFGHLLKSFDDDAYIKSCLQTFIDSTDTYESGISGKSIGPFRKRACVECALLMSTKFELGLWALEQREGIQQLMVLVSTADTRCQEVAAETMCLCSSVENGQPLLAPIIDANVLHNLLASSSESVKAAAAATLTKLSLKAKAFDSEDTDELTTVLNSVLTVLKQSPLSATNSKTSRTDSKTKDTSKETKLTTFSKLDGSIKAVAPSGKKDEYAASVADVEAGVAYVSVERAIEVLAALVGKTFVKEEIVHGSYRVAPSIAALVAIEVDPRSTAAYGIAHILSQLTVTNHELRAKALAEKDMTIEQYEQLAELQRIKSKDVEEKKPDVDIDSDVLLRRRIQCIVAANGLRVLINLIGNTSAQTKEAASRALRQICVDESIRGQFIQQGGLKACVAVAVDEEIPKATRRECAHAVAKSLVTTNPTLLTEHVRLGCVAPLLMLCRDVDSSNLQQFEACLALTNLTSVGEVEQDRLVNEKGLSAVHYLMFSSHKLVRRAATEVFCNMPLHEGVLKMFRKPETVRLWLGMCEEWANELSDVVKNTEDDNQDALVEVLYKNENLMNAFLQTESYKTARAAAGTLAVAANDPEVCVALVAENAATTVVSLLDSKLGELVHRTLVLCLDLVNVGGISAAKHLLENNVVPSLHVGVRLGNPQLGSLCKEVGMALSKALKASEAADSGTGSSTGTSTVPKSSTSNSSTQSSTTTAADELD